MDERTRRNLESSAEALRRSYEREIPRPEDMWQLPEPQRQPQPEPPPRPKPVPAQATMSAADSAAWNKWLAEAISKRLETFGAGVGDVLGGIIREERADTQKAIAEAEGRVTDKITASDQAVVDLLMQLEARVAALEEAQQQRMQASTRPRLIGGSDAA